MGKALGSIVGIFDGITVKVEDDRIVGEVLGAEDTRKLMGLVEG